MILDVNTNALNGFSNILKGLHKSAFPSAVRDTLSLAARDVKTKTMPETSDDFIHRTPTFFKANSKFIPATGFNISTMKSEVGFYSNQLRNKETNFSVKDLEQQEAGGVIGGKSFKPTIFARKGNSNTGMIRPNARISIIKKKYINANNITHVTKKQRFFVAAKQAGYGGFVLSENILWRIDQDPKILDKKKSTQITYGGSKVSYSHFTGIIKRTPLYSYKHRGTTTVRHTHFMQRASEKSVKKMEDFYVEQAHRQIKKYMK